MDHYIVNVGDDMSYREEVDATQRNLKHIREAHKCMCIDIERYFL